MDAETAKKPAADVTDVADRASLPLAGEPSVQGPRVLFSRTGLAVGSFVVMSLGAYLGWLLYQGKPLSLPRPKFFPSKKNRPLRSGPLPTAAGDRHRPPPKIPATVQPIEAKPGTRPLAHFYRSLRRTEQKQKGAITRVSHWGDSQIVSDNITSTLRRRLQRRFGDAGHGFLSVGRPASYLHSDVIHRVRGWRHAGVARGGFSDRRYGLNGMHTHSRSFGDVTIVGTKDDGEVGRRVSRLEISYLAHDTGGRFELTIDGGKKETINTRRSDGTQTKTHVVQVPDGAHRFQIRSIGFGQNRIFGLVLERTVPGIVYDSLGLKGAQMHDLMRNDPVHFTQQLRWRRPNLLVFGFGTNESYQRIGVSTYPPKWRKLLRFVRQALPTSSCLVLGPVDRVFRRRLSHPRTAPLNKALRQVALAEGCAFWDTFKAMGGPGAAVAWRRARLMWGDLAHLNPYGGKKLGTLISKALLERYTNWKRRVEYEEKKKRAKPVRSAP